MGAVDVRRLWPDVINALNRLRKATWALVSHNAQVIGLEGDVLTLGFATQGLREQFTGGNHEAPLKQAITDVIGAEWRIEAIVHQGDAPATPPAQAAPAAARPPQAAPTPTPPTDQAPSADAPPPPWDEGPTDGAQSAAAYDASRAAREAIQPTRIGMPDTQGQTDEQSRAEELAARDADVRPDDEAFEDEQLGGAELLQRELGAQIIEEIKHQ